MAEGFKLGSRDAAKEARTESIVAALRTLVEAEKAKDPNFNISKKFIEEAIKNNPQTFPGLGTYASLIWYFFNDLNILRSRLDLPDKLIKKNDF